MVPDGSGSDKCLAPSEEPGRHDARSPDIGRVNDRPSDGARGFRIFFATHPAASSYPGSDQQTAVSTGCSLPGVVSSAELATQMNGGDPA
jgi:hypothetical protein